MTLMEIGDLERPLPRINADKRGSGKRRGEEQRKNLTTDDTDGDRVIARDPVIW